MVRALLLLVAVAAADPVGMRQGDTSRAAPASAVTLPVGFPSCPEASGLAAGHTTWVWATSDRARANGALPKTTTEQVVSADAGSGTFVTRTATRVDEPGYRYEGVRISTRGCTAAGLVEYSHRLEFRSPGSSGMERGVWVNAWSAPVVQLGPAMALGATWTTLQRGDATRIGADGKTRVEPIDLRSEWTIVGQEPVVTPAGQWMAWVARKGDGRETRWYVDGVGMVQDDESWLVEVR